MLRVLIGFLLMIAGVFGGLYVAIWWGMIDPILTVAEAIDNDTVTAGLVGWEVIKFFLKEILAAIVFYAGVFGGLAIASAVR